ncbi:MAG: oatA 3 [Mucilaginibacter sp.]|nr:oatA 3 [Mucilaginibacter sp.]
MQQPLVTSNISDKHKLLGLDHLRAVAIISVFLFHYQFFGHPEWEKNVAGFGWTGVDLFFVLSGFLISGQLFSAIAKGNPISLGEFFIKRFFRILPPFLVVLTLYFAFPFLREWGSPAPLWRYLTFTLNFGFDLKKYGTFSHDWSLCVEEQFYLILPLIFWLFTYFKAGKQAISLILALFVAGFILRLWGWYHFMEPVLQTNNLGLTWNKYIYYPTYNRLDGLLIGVSIAGVFTFYPTVKEWINKRSNIIMLLGLAVLLAAYFVSTPQDTFYTCLFGFPLISLAYGIILAAIVCPSNMLFSIKSWLTSQIATLSYSIYLSHKIVIHSIQSLLEKVGMDKNSNLAMLICIIAVIVGALVLRYVVEKPALRIRNIILNRSKSPTLRNSLPGEGGEARLI